MGCATGSDGPLTVLTNTGTGWQPPANLGGRFVGQPGLVATPAGPVAFVMGADRAVWVRTVRTGWASLSGYIDPGVTASS